MFSCQRHSPQKKAAEVNGQGAPLPLASLDSNHCIKSYWAGQTLAYLQSQANEKYASAAEPGASLLHGMAFLFLEPQTQREVRHVANERPGGRGELTLQGRRGWPVASFVLPETWLHGPSRVGMQNVDQ